MSLPDHLLDPPDDDVCETHSRLLPCQECRADALDEQAEWQLERLALDRTMRGRVCQ